jgi:Multicopper oxidase
VSISCDPNFTFSIDDHVMTVIEVDGANVIPLQVDSIQIFAGKPLQGYTHFVNIPLKRPALLLCRKLIVSVWYSVEESGSYDFLARGQPDPCQLL